MKEINIFIYRRDLRIHDNTTLNALYETNPGTQTLHVFIFNPKQITPKQNEFFNKNSVEFLVQSLKDLNGELKNNLHCFYGAEIPILAAIHKHITIKSVGFNLDYTPYARYRDKQIQDWCQRMGIECIAKEDYTLFDIDSVRTPAYEVFTPFYNKCLSLANKIRTPSSSVKTGDLYINKQLPNLIDVSSIDKFYFRDPNPNLAVTGGRKNALQILDKISKGEFATYDKHRDTPSLNKTTKLSAYIKYGNVSIREVFHTVKKRYGLHHALIRELLWREFYASITYSFPRVLEGKSFKLKYNNLKWKHNPAHWAAFMKGQTGFPFVDAGIRQTLVSGWCHNRARMILAMFASKDIHVHPTIFEKWFACRLVDYDPSSNSGGVQWAYGIGSDSQPYFRIFNPFLQSKKYDPEAKYIKEWIPELKDIPPKDIHNWATTYTKYPNISYPGPILDHATQSKILVNQFLTVKG
jgi:deoxyribodipyrimidine photo-lyase